MFKTVWTSNDLAGASSLPPFPLGTIKGCSIRIDNQSPYALKVIDSQGTTVDYIRPYMYVVQPVENAATLSLQIDSATAAVVAQPYQSVSYRLIKGVVAYQTGSLWQQNMGAEIQGTANVNITNAQIEAAIQGTVTAIIQGAVTIANNNLNVTTQAGSQVTVANTIAANIQNASIDTNSTILNEYVSNNPTVVAMTQTTKNWGAGNSALAIINDPIPSGTYDVFYVFLKSLNGYYYKASSFDFYAVAFGNYQGSYVSNKKITEISTTTNHALQFFELSFDSVFGTSLNFTLTQYDSTGTNITANADTLTVEIYGVRAEITINNTTSNPALQQAVTGAYSSQQSFNQQNMGIGTNYTLIPSSVGGYVQSLQVTYGQGNYNIYNGSQLIDSVSFGSTTQSSKSYNFGSGVVNNGINVTCTSSTTTGLVTGFGAISQNTPPGVPKVIA